MFNYPQQIADWFLDLIFPVRCLKCSKFGQYICKKCLRTIPVKKSFECIGCKKPTPFGRTCYVCAKTNRIDQLLIVADYKNPLVEDSLKAFKYRFISDMSQPLLVLLKGYLKWLTLVKKFNVFESNPLLIPVPLHKWRLNWRGFNQAEILAKDLSDTFQMELVCDGIRRISHTTPQADIKEKEKRLRNLNGVFRVACKDKLIGREVLLIDDVCTTGATLNECAQILKESGATKVMALVIARG